MTRKVLREVVIETQEIWLLHLPRERANEQVAEARPACPVCAAAMLAPAEAAALHGVSQRVLFHWLEQGLVHFCEPAEGQLYFCAASLPPTQGKALKP